MWCAHSFAQIELSWGSARNNIMKVDLVTGEWRKGTPTSASLVVLSWANGGRGSLAVCQRRKPNMSRALCVVFVCRCRFRCCRCCCCWVVCWVSYKVSKFLMPMAKPQNSARQPQSPFPPPPLSLSRQLLLLPHATQQKVSATFRQHMQIFTRTWELTFHLFLFSK